MKTDARSRYTRKVIRDSFYALLKEKPVEKITVRELCEKAEINRATFYKHYQDCYDLLDKIEEEALVHFDELLASVEIRGLQPTLLDILRTIQENAASFEAFNRQSDNRSFIHRLAGRCFHYMEQRIPLASEFNQEKNQQGMTYSFLAGGVVAVMEFWMHGGCKEPPEQVGALIVELTGKVVSHPLDPFR